MTTWWVLGVSATASLLAHKPMLFYSEGLCPLLN